MAPTLSNLVQGSISENLLELSKRQFGNYPDGRGYYGNSAWYDWGRWVLFGGLVLLAILIMLSMSCINARRRRSHGVQPIYGTGWLAGKTADGQNGTTYNQGTYQQPQYAAAAPPYEPQYNAPANTNTTGSTFGPNQGYYGQPGIELQQPNAAYHGNGGQNVYDAPVGAPPTKTHY